MTGPSLNEAVEWRIQIWAPAVSSALEHAACLIPPNAIVLEVGYNTGMMSCYMAARYGWNIVGYEITESSRLKAEKAGRCYGLEEMTDFRVCLPNEMLYVEGPYDAVFLKSVMYHISDKDIYRNWIDWLHDILKDGGVLIAIENGRGGVLDKFYRKKIKRSRWADFLLFNRWVEQEFQRRFRNVNFRYFGRFSQFFTFLPKVCGLI
ncbi:MAG: class I SAM-dependent methyltransferase, partial [Syntrophales bacterium]